MYEGGPYGSPRQGPPQEAGAAAAAQPSFAGALPLPPFHGDLEMAGGGGGNYFNPSAMDLGGQAPFPPSLMFGAASGAGAEATDFLGGSLNLDDVFSDLYFTPDGDLLEVPGDDSPNGTGGGGSGGGSSVTLSAPGPLTALAPLTLMPAAAAAAVGPLAPPPLAAAAAAAPAPAPAAAAAAAAAAPKGVAGLGISLPRHARFGAPQEKGGGSSGSGDDDDAYDGKPSPGSSKRPRPRGGSSSGAGSGSGSLGLHGGPMTEEQKLERRERNREHAKRSRVRKKFLLDSLQRSVNALQEENDLLKGSIREHLGPECEPLLANCTPAPDSLVATSAGRRPTQVLDDPDYSLVKALQTAQQNFVITDASQPDNPIVYASGGFVELTGYDTSQILGRNCRFLQGPETDPRAVDKIRYAVERGEDTSVCLLNYRADGEKFWNQFFVAALRDADGKTVNFVGVQCKVSDEYAAIVVQKQEKGLEELHRQRERERQRLAKLAAGGGGGGMAGGVLADGAAAAAAMR